MKKILFYIFMLFAAVTLPVTLASCSDDDDKGTIDNGDNDDTLVTVTKSYRGTLTVNQTFTEENIMCGFNVNAAGDTATLHIHEVKFAENMPVRLDITVPGIPCRTSDGITTFSGTDIVPLIGVAPSPGFTFIEIQGMVEKGDLSFNAEITGRGTFVYSGTDNFE